MRSATSSPKGDNGDAYGRGESPLGAVERKRDEAAAQLAPLQRLVALAAALCLFLSSIEYLIPKPLPFLRIGLANLPLLIALDLFPVSHYLLLLGLKIVGQSLIQGTLFSFVFLLSLVGSLASGLLMLLVRRVFGSSISLIGTSVVGALASNLSQLTLARYLVFGPSAWLVAPPFLVIGLVSSVVLGVFAEVYRGRSLWLRTVSERLKTAK